MRLLQYLADPGLMAGVINTGCRISFSPPVFPGIHVLVVKITVADAVFAVAGQIVPGDRQSSAFFAHKDADIVPGDRVFGDQRLSPESPDTDLVLFEQGPPHDDRAARKTHAPGIVPEGAAFDNKIGKVAMQRPCRVLENTMDKQTAGRVIKKYLVPFTGAPCFC